MPQKTGERAGSPAASGVQPRARSIGAAGLHAVFGGAFGVGLSKPEGDAGCAGDRADEGARVAISALWLSAHWHLSWTGRIRDEPRASLSAVAGSGSASAAQAAEEARGCAPPAATGADGAEPGVVLRLRVSERGAPALLRSDNGPEFVSKALLSRIAAQGIGTALIEPGKPWQNGVAESFNGKFRDECLSLEWFPH